MAEPPIKHEAGVEIGAVDGRVWRQKEATVQCKRCPDFFTFVKKTARRWYCPKCQVIVEEERIVKEKMRQKIRLPRPGSPPRRPLIRYAGYDRDSKFRGE